MLSGRCIKTGWILALLTGVLLTSCINDPFDLNTAPPQGTKSGLNIRISTLGSGGDMPLPNAGQGAPDTKAVVTDPALLAGTEAERTVYCLDLFLFDNEHGGLAAHKRLTVSHGEIGGVSSIFPATSQAAWANINIADLVNEGGYGTRVLAAVANWDEAVMGGVLRERLMSEGASLATLEQMVIQPPFLAAGGLQKSPFMPGELLMFGKSAPMTYANAAAAVPAFAIELTRMVARLDLRLSVGGAMAGANTLTRLRIEQAADRAYLATPTVGAGASTMPNYTSQARGIELDGGTITPGTGSDSFYRTIYLPENNLRAGDYNRTNATCVLVNIPHNGTDNWYRFWINESDNRTVGTNNYHINRNTFYQITATITTKGGATIETAVETQDIHFGAAYYTVAYDVQPGMIGVPAMQRFSLGTTITVASVLDAGASGRELYPVVFNTADDETGTVYYPGDTFILTGHTTLYARLRPTAPRITLGADGRLAITYDARDAGLLFKFGSVVGIYSGVRGRNAVLPTFPPGGTPFNATVDVAYNPTGVAIAAYSSVPFMSAAGDFADWRSHTLDNVRAGKGDPCRLVGLTQAQINAGNIDNGIWRMPTQSDNATFVGGGDGRSATDIFWSQPASPWGVQGIEYPRRNNAAMEDFLPTYTRRNGDGSFIVPENFYRATGSVGYYPSENLYYFLAINTRDEGSWVGWTEWIPTDFAAAVRCVRQGVPRITIGSGSDGKPMLTLTDDPKDGGLLFKYGSTMGLYSAGGQRNLDNSTGLSPFVSDPWDAGDVAFNLDAITYTNYVDIPFSSTPILDKRYHDGAIKEVGGRHGDPCRLVGLTQTEITGGKIDNGIWRLPTYAEVSAMFPSVGAYGEYPGTSISGYYMTGTGVFFHNWLPQSPYRRNMLDPLYGVGFGDTSPNWNHTHLSSSPDLWIRGQLYSGLHGAPGMSDYYVQIAGIRFCVRQ